MAILRYMEMFLLKLYLILAMIALLVDGAQWQTRYKTFQSGILNDVVMECIIEGGSNFTGFYRQNGIEIVNTNRIKIEKSDNTVTLDIEKITEADYDLYYCNDTSGSDIATLEIQASLERNPETPQILLAGDPGEIEYRVYGNPRPRKITWFISSGGETKRTLASIDGKGTDTTDTSGGRYTIDNKGTLHINKTNADDAGEYSITVSTYGGSRLKGKLNVKIEFKLELKTKPPKSYIRAVGQDLFIPCEFLYEDSDTKWTFTSTDGIVKRIKDGVSAKGLNLTTVSIESEGTYACSASNKYGNLSANSSLTQVIDPAKITIEEFKGIIKKELTAYYELVCAASGKPVPNVRLSKLKEDKSAFENIASGVGEVKKRFPKLGITDGGVYSCYVDNGAKTLRDESMAETRNMTLEVFAPTKIVEKATTKSVVSAIGLNFTIQCSAKGYPYPKVRLIGNGEDIATQDETEDDDVVTAKIVVVKAKQSNFEYENITCFATNAYGTENATIPLTQILKAPCPKKLKSVGTIGLSIIDLQWEAVPGAEKYYIYINDTRKMEFSKINQISIKYLKRKTFYSIKVASVNLAGVGNHCDPVLFETADIVRPNAIAATEFSLEDVTSTSATISWTAPSNIPNAGIDVLTYDAKYCELKNDTVVVEGTCKVPKEQKGNRLILKHLLKKTDYQIVVTAINQGKKGEESQPFLFKTQDVQAPTPAPSRGQSPGLSSGEIAGIIVAIILIVLIVVDVFCCFFNNCGFSHCCFETFCASKDKKFLPVDTNDTNGANEAEGYEAQELEEKVPNDVV